MRSAGVFVASDRFETTMTVSIHAPSCILIGAVASVSVVCHPIGGLLNGLG